MWLSVSLGCAAGGVYSDVDEATRLTLRAQEEYQLGQTFGRKQRQGVSARYDSGGDRTDEGHYLLLDVSQEPAGTYVLAVRVTDQVTGKEVQAQRRVILE